MRLIHTADLHLDACYAGAGFDAAFGRERRAGLRATLANILQRAAEWPADAVLIAGDLFDHDRISRETVGFLQDAFADISPVTILIAPGNRDPFTPTSPYATESWPENVLIFSRPEWQQFDVSGANLTVHGFAFDGADISRNPFGALAIPQDGRIHVAVAHGSEMSHTPRGKVPLAPFAASAAAKPGLAYLALGHYHETRAIDAPHGTAMHYCGAPEGHGFEETGARYFLEVQIERDAARVERKAASDVEYASHTLDCSPFESAHEVVETILAKTGDRSNSSILRIVLTGAASPAWQGDMESIRAQVAQRVLALDLQDNTELLEDYNALGREQTSLGSFIKRMNDELDDAPDEDRRRLVRRARQVGLAAYRGRDLPTAGLPRED